MIDQQLAAHGGRSVYARGEGDARSDLDGQFEDWFAKAAPVAVKEFGVDSSTVSIRSIARTIIRSSSRWCVRLKPS